MNNYFKRNDIINYKGEQCVVEDISASGRILTLRNEATSQVFTRSAGHVLALATHA